MMTWFLLQLLCMYATRYGFDEDMGWYMKGIDQCLFVTACLMEVSERCAGRVFCLRLVFFWHLCIWPFFLIKVAVPYCAVLPLVASVSHCASSL